MSNRRNNKVGILTLSHTSNMNYGAMLQSFALKSLVGSLGCEPYIIDWKFKKEQILSFDDIQCDSQLRYFYLCFRRFLGVKLKFILEWIACSLGEKPFKLFSNQFLSNKTEEVNRNNISDLNNTLDSFIVGSDQVWRYESCPDLYAFFLDFADDCHRKVSYAASFGIDQWNEAPEKVTEKVCALIRRFDAISVRELSGVDICSTVFNVQAQFVLDPTLLLSERDYRPIFESESDLDLQDQNYLACMYLDAKKSGKICNELSQVIGFPAISIRGEEIGFLSLTFIRYNTVARWLNYIRNAGFIVTDSYHCAIFCILFKKEFAVLGNKKRGIARLESLLSLINLKDRLFFTESNLVESEIWFQKIDYKQVEVLLNAEREKSKNFLTNALK